MTQLYRHKWTSAEGDILTDNGQPTDGFLFWCKKTAHLTDEQWRKGFEMLESEVEKNKREGKSSWPPSYAEFIGMAKTTLSPTGTNAVAYLSIRDPRHPSHPQNPLNPDYEVNMSRLALDKPESDGKKAAEKALAEMKGCFEL